MQKSSLKSLHSVWLPSAGLALLLLGASAPRLTAQISTQSWNFNSQTDTPFTRYQIPAAAGYGAPTWSFPTNTAGPTNYAYSISVPGISYDTYGDLQPRAGAIWESADALYGDPSDSVNLGRYSVAADLTAWNYTYVNEIIGLGSLVHYTTFTNGQFLVAGWGSGAFTLALAEVSGFPIFELWGCSTFGQCILNTTHQYRMVMSSWDANQYGAFHMLLLYDKGNTNTPWISSMGVDAAAALFGLPGGYCGTFMANIQAPPPFNLSIDGVQLGGNATEGAAATFDNYYAYQPVLNSVPPYTMPAMVCDTYPPPCGSAPEWQPTITVAIINQDDNVKDAADIHLWLDGVQVPDANLTVDIGTGDSAFYGGNGHGVYKQNPLDLTGAPVIFPGATITYQIPTVLPPLSQHTNVFAFEDDGGVWHTNSWTWTSAYPYLYASNSLPIGSLTVPGFATRTAYATPAANVGSYPGIENCAPGAQQLLDNTTLPFNMKSTNQVAMVAWGQIGNEVSNVTLIPFPGLYFTNIVDGFDNLAIQAQAYLQLAAGTNTFHINSDDGVGIYSGGDTMTRGIVLAESPFNSTYNADFVVVAQAAGLYPINLFYEQGGGAAVCLLQNYDTNTPPQLHTVGDTANGGIPAYILEPGALQVNITPSAAVTAGAQWQLDGGALHNNGDIVCGLMPGSHTVTYTAAAGYTTPASTNVTVISTQTNITTGTYVAAGPTLWSTAQIQKSGTSWTQETGAVLSTVNQTLTLPTLPTANRYYHLVGSVQYKITKVQKVGSTVVFTYQ